MALTGRQKAAMLLMSLDTATAAQMVKDLDPETVQEVADRSLQEALTGVGARELALALHRADEMITEKIRSNISGRAAAAVDEEASFMLAPGKEDVEAARDAIVRILREMNEEGELVFAKEQYDGRPGFGQ